MQLDAELAAAIGVTSSIVSTGVGYGIMKEKLRRLEKDFEELKQEQKSYVTLPHFDAVITPLNRTLDTVQRDVKEILRAVSTKTVSKL